MKTKPSALTLTALALFTALSATSPAHAQVAGETTTIGVSLVALTQVAMG